MAQMYYRPPVARYEPVSDIQSIPIQQSLPRPVPAPQATVSQVPQVRQQNFTSGQHLQTARHITVPGGQSHSNLQDINFPQQNYLNTLGIAKEGYLQRPLRFGEATNDSFVEQFRREQKKVPEQTRTFIFRQRDIGGPYSILPFDIQEEKRHMTETWRKINDKFKHIPELHNFLSSLPITSRRSDLTYICFIKFVSMFLDYYDFPSALSEEEINNIIQEIQQKWNQFYRSYLDFPFNSWGEYLSSDTPILDTLVLHYGVDDLDVVREMIQRLGNVQKGYRILMQKYVSQAKDIDVELPKFISLFLEAGAVPEYDFLLKPTSAVFNLITFQEEYKEKLPFIAHVIDSLKQLVPNLDLSLFTNIPGNFENEDAIYNLMENDLFSSVSSTVRKELKEMPEEEFYETVRIMDFYSEDEYLRYALTGVKIMLTKLEEERNLEQFLRMEDQYNSKKIQPYLEILLKRGKISRKQAEEFITQLQSLSSDFHVNEKYRKLFDITEKNNLYSDPVFGPELERLKITFVSTTSKL